MCELNEKDATIKEQQQRLDNVNWLLNKASDLLLKKHELIHEKDERIVQQSSLLAIKEESKITLVEQLAKEVEVSAKAIVERDLLRKALEESHEQLINLKPFAAGLILQWALKGEGDKDGN
ncbi:hypothetical protein D3C73_1013540 [compost metagenome]